MHPGMSKIPSKYLYTMDTYMHTYAMNNKITEAKNKLKEMREQVKGEMEHIPRGSSLQNMLRLYYQPLRMNSLGKKAQIDATKEDILLQSIDAVKEEHPEFIPQYNTKFFIMKK
jgi:hypothetical protein